MAVETPAASLGTSCPDFALPAVDGARYALRDFASCPVLVVMFICNHCPYVQAVEDRLIRLARERGPKGVAFVGVRTRTLSCSSSRTAMVLLLSRSAA